MKKIIEAIKNSEKIGILPHILMDGDTLGSSLALAMICKKIGKEVVVMPDDEVPSTLAILPGQEHIGTVEDCDLIIAIDTSDIERLGERAKYFYDAKFAINIDHHISNEIDCYAKYVDISASATGEIIYSIAKALNVDIDEDIAMCLYVAISTDTGGFRFTNTTSNTHMIAADLLSYNINVAEISRRVFDMVSYSKIRLMGHVISAMKLYEEGKIAAAYIPYSVIEVSNAKTDDFEGLVNIGRNLQNVDVSILLREIKPGHFKGSLRSNSDVDVASISLKLNGGGHKKAAGFSAEGSPEVIIRHVIDLIKEVL